MSQQRIRGVLSPVVTPFNRDLSPDPERFIAHCRWLNSQSCGLAVFGTNSEANSLSVNERIALLDALLAADVEPARMMPGTGCCALTDTVRLTEHAVKAGCAGVLMLPPFYYKDVSEDGLFRNFAEVVERVVGITVKLVERLLKAYPTAIAGMKDSSGDWSNTESFLKAFAKSGFDVFPGSESFLLAAMRNGGAGCISATANVNPAAIDKLYREWQKPGADLQQEALNVVRKTVGQYVMIPALKQVIAYYSDDAAWGAVRPPLTELSAVQVHSIIEGLKQLDFDMPGLDRTQAKAA
jgi:4-hydroxy-tetrahydrodipicolinate synthase